MMEPRIIMYTVSWTVSVGFTLQEIRVGGETHTKLGSYTR